VTELPDRPTDLANNRELLNALLAGWRPYLIVAARNRMRHRELHQWNKVFDDDDLVQEALLRAARHVRHYDPARGAFKTFLCLQLEAVCVELFRLRGRQQRSRRPAVAFRERSRLASRPDRRTAGPPAVAEENDFWEHAARDLDADERTILRLRHRGGLEKRQAARAMGLTAGAFEHRYSKLQKKLAARHG
jgi:RNA polymerase sigma factor (sigma-70 family)